MREHKPNPTQQETVIAYIETHGSITAKQAFRISISQLGARIFELKKKGFVFNTPTIKVIDGWGKEIPVTKYSIKSYPPEVKVDNQGQYQINV